MKQPQSFRFRADQREGGIECQADILYADGSEEHVEGDEAIAALGSFRPSKKSRTKKAGAKDDAAASGDGAGSEDGEQGEDDGE